MVERFVHRALFRLALVVIELGLKLLFGSVSIGYKLAPGAERQPADVAIGSAGRAPDESDDFELAVRHRAMMAGGECGVKCRKQPVRFGSSVP